MSDSEQPILQAIENGNYKIAQTLLLKKLKKYPNKLYYYALNNYILFKQGKVKEAVQESLKLKEKTPSDPQTLKLLYEILKSTNHKQDATLVFENAIKKYANHDLIFAWFELALKDFDIRSIQKSCMALQKFLKSRKYTLWAAFTYYLQSVQPDSTTVEKSLYPKVALKLVETLKPYKNEQEVYIYVKILYQIGNFEEAVLSIEEFSKGRKFDLELQIILLACLNELENWDLLYKYSYQILFEDKLDDFDTWKYLIKASNNIGNSDEVAVQLRTSTSRNSRLANVIYSKEVLKSETSFNEALVAYYNEYKYKLCCFNDINYFYESEPTYFDKSTFITLINSSSQKIVSGGEFNERELNVLVNNQKFNKLLGNAENLLNTNFEYYNLFQSVLLKKDEKDYFAGDEFILMNVELLLENGVSEGKLIENVFKSIVLLENSAKHDDHEFRLRLWLMKLYSYINCSSLVNANFDHLDIKMIQNDTLSHYITTRISSLNPNQLMLQQHLISIQKFYLTIEQEVEEMVTNGFEQLVLNKIEGFLEFGTRINNSVTKMLNLIEMLKMSKIIGNNQIIHYSMEALKSQDPLLIPELYDNRDFTSEWKYGAQEINEIVHSAISIGPKQSSEYIKSYYLRELILQETHADKSKQLITKLNKLLNDETTQKQLTSSESWSYKIYLSLFKIYIVNPDNDADFNFLIKNLSVNNIKNKVFKASELTSNSFLLTWELNHKLLTVLELVRNINLFTTMHHLPKQYSPKVAELKKANSSLLEELRDLKREVDEKVDSALKQIEKSVMESLADNADISPKVLHNTFAKISTSLQESSLSRRVP